jgi:hypothetical protein
VLLATRTRMVMLQTRKHLTQCVPAAGRPTCCKHLHYGVVNTHTTRYMATTACCWHALLSSPGLNIQPAWLLTSCQMMERDNNTGRLLAQCKRACGAHKVSTVEQARGHMPQTQSKLHTRWDTDDALYMSCRGMQLMSGPATSVFTDCYGMGWNGCHPSCPTPHPAGGLASHFSSLSTQPKPLLRSCSIP